MHSLVREVAILSFHKYHVSSSKIKQIVLQFWEVRVREEGPTSLPILWGTLPPVCLDYNLQD